MIKDDIFNAILFKQYGELATNEIDEYLKLCDISNMEEVDRTKHISKVYQIANKLIEVDTDYINPESIARVISKLASGYEENNLQLKLLNLLLSLIEKATGIKSGPLPKTHQVKQEQPVLTPDMLLNSNLHRRMYELIENPNLCRDYLANPQGQRGVLVLWLVLKEGIRYLSDVVTLIDNKDSVFLIDKHWLFEVKEKRYWLSTKAELLLSAYYKEPKLKVNGKAMSDVNKILYTHKLIPRTERVKFSVLCEALKAEYILYFGAVEFGISSYSHKTTHLNKYSLHRVITGTPVEMQGSSSSELAATVRQKRAWLSANDPTCNAVRNRPISTTKEVTVKQQLSLIEKYTSKMKKLGIADRKKSTTALRNQLRLRLEDKEIAKSYPWCWIVLGWMYQLLDKGGKVKSVLKLNTIRSYIDYVAKPFITEFSGCDPSLLTSLDWAEKLNIAAEEIQSPTKQAYIAYFAEYLIDSGIANGLCLSDIDIPSVGASVNANLVTLEEADKIVDELEVYGSRIGQLSKLVFYLGFYGGLRRGEISGLQYKDFHFNDDLSYFNLHIRPNQYRELKSSDSSRNLPLDVLMPELVKIQLREYLSAHKLKFMRLDSLVFDDTSLLSRAFDTVTATMQRVLGDNTLRFHHYRHSFCNWNWVRLHHVDNDNMRQFPFLQHGYFSTEACLKLQSRLSTTSYSRKRMWALAGLLGHASPTTTMSSYLHLGDWIRRVRFASHQSSEFELRAFWGQRIKVDEWGRVQLKPSFKKLSKIVQPPVFVCTPYKIPTIDPEGIGTMVQHSNVSDIDLTLLWRIIRRLGEGLSIGEVSEGLKITRDAIEKIIEKDAECVNLAFRQSKYQLPALLNYEKLDSGNIDTVQALINRYRRAKDTDDFKNLKLGYMPNIISSLVGAKDSLIRTNDTKAALTFIRLLKLLKIPADNLKVKWYFPNTDSYAQEHLSRYREHLKFWQNALTNDCGYSDLKVECIIPKSLKELLPTENDGITWSDDGRFLNYKPPGYITIHVIQKYFKHARFNEKGERVLLPQRTRALVSFIRLLCIKQSLD